MSKHKSLAPADIPVDRFEIHKITDGSNVVVSAHRNPVHRDTVEVWLEDIDANCPETLANLQLNKESALLLAEQLLVAVGDVS